MDDQSEYYSDDENETLDHDEDGDCEFDNFRYDRFYHDDDDDVRF